MLEFVEIDDPMQTSLEVKYDPRIMVSNLLASTRDRGGETTSPALEGAVQKFLEVLDWVEQETCLQPARYQTLYVKVSAEYTRDASMLEYVKSCASAPHPPPFVSVGPPASETPFVLWKATCDCEALVANPASQFDVYTRVLRHEDVYVVGVRLFPFPPGFSSSSSSNSTARVLNLERYMDFLGSLSEGDTCVVAVNDSVRCGMARDSPTRVFDAEVTEVTKRPDGDKFMSLTTAVSKLPVLQFSDVYDAFSAPFWVFPSADQVLPKARFHAAADAAVCISSVLDPVSIVTRVLNCQTASEAMDMGMNTSTRRLSRERGVPHTVAAWKDGPLPLPLPLPGPVCLSERARLTLNRDDEVKTSAAATVIGSYVLPEPDAGVTFEEKRSCFDGMAVQVVKDEKGTWYDRTWVTRIGNVASAVALEELHRRGAKNVLTVTAPSTETGGGARAFRRVLLDANPSRRMTDIAEIIGDMEEFMDLLFKTSSPPHGDGPEDVGSGGEDIGADAVAVDADGSLLDMHDSLLGTGALTPSEVARFAAEYRSTARELLFTSSRARAHAFGTGCPMVVADALLGRSFVMACWKRYCRALTSKAIASVAAFRTALCKAVRVDPGVDLMLMHGSDSRQVKKAASYMEQHVEDVLKTWRSDSTMLMTAMIGGLCSIIEQGGLMGLAKSPACAETEGLPAYACILRQCGLVRVAAEAKKLDKKVRAAAAEIMKDKGERIRVWLDRGRAQMASSSKTRQHTETFRKAVVACRDSYHQPLRGEMEGRRSDDSPNVVAVRATRVRRGTAPPDEDTAGPHGMIRHATFQTVEPTMSPVEKGVERDPVIARMTAASTFDSLSGHVFRTHSAVLAALSSGKLVTENVRKAYLTSPSTLDRAQHHDALYKLLRSDMPKHVIRSARDASYRHDAVEGDVVRDTSVSEFRRRVSSSSQVGDLSIGVAEKFCRTLSEYTSRPVTERSQEQTTTVLAYAVLKAAATALDVPVDALAAKLPSSRGMCFTMAFFYARAARLFESAKECAPATLIDTVGRELNRNRVKNLDAMAQLDADDMALLSQVTNLGGTSRVQAIAQIVSKARIVTPPDEVRDQAQVLSLVHADEAFFGLEV